ncbi:uncharacterized protein METZ01_LOCUS116080 [marine metagenome]|uniref:Uncharacterized protein n=1 Tax=marine metagenome TaxID=408172 RepID=A0A381XEQ5_9ZZZZ
MYKKRQSFEKPKSLTQKRQNIISLFRLMFFKKPHLLFSLQKYLLSNATHLMFGWVVR